MGDEGGVAGSDCTSRGLVTRNLIADLNVRQLHPGLSKVGGVMCRVSTMVGLHQVLTLEVQAFEGIGSK